MRISIAITLILGASILTPAKAIYCVTCDDCSNPNSRQVNQTCDGQDSCMKVDFGSYISKKCAIHDRMCSKDGFKTNMQSLYNRVQNLLGATQVDVELLANLNGEGRTVLNCCNDMNYCNSGMHKSLSLIALIGMTVVYVVI